MRWSPDRPAPLSLAAIPLCAVLLISLSYFHDRFRTFHWGVNGQFALLSSPDADGDSTLVAAHALRFTALGAIRNDSALDVDLVMRTKQGLVHGVTDGEFPDVRAYRGIPFAEPPVGHLRWSRTREPQPWNSTHTADDKERVLEAYRHGPVCPQMEFYVLQSEDCLYLNVFAPSRKRAAGQRLPVMAFIYGGGFVVGSGSEHRIYDGSYWAQTRDALIVTFNYRLGPLGFLVTDDLEGNFALFDQQMALRWIRDNIAEFGGDPDRVTLVGESAGATSVAIHLTWEASFPLFSRAILQSNPSGLHYRTLNEARVIGRRLAALVGCRNAVNQLDCLRAVPVKTLIAMRLPSNLPLIPGKANPSLLRNVLTWFPVIDGTVVRTQTPVQAFEAGMMRPNTPVIMGHNLDEATLFRYAGQLVLKTLRFIFPRSSSLLDRAQLRRMTKKTASAVLRYLVGVETARQINDFYSTQYPDGSPWECLWQMITDVLFHCPTRRILKSVSSGQSHAATYSYLFDAPAEYLGTLGGHCASDSVCHASELPYLFHSGTTLITFTPWELELSERIISTWTQFMAQNTSVSLTTDFGVSWPVFRHGHGQRLPEQDEAFLHIRQRRWTAEYGFQRQTCDFIDSLNL